MNLPPCDRLLISNNLTFPYRDISKYGCWFPDDTTWKCFVLKRLQAHIAGDCLISGHCEGVCTLDSRVCALVRASTRDSRRRWHGQKPLIFMRFHGLSLGCQHEIWSKQHNGKVSRVLSGVEGGEPSRVWISRIGSESMTCPTLFSF